MNLQSRLRRRVASLAFGPARLPQFCNLGLREPQAHIKVWLVGMNMARDVTHRNVIAATRPLTVGIGLEDADPRALSRSRLDLEFRRVDDTKSLLGKMGLVLVDTVRLEKGGWLCLFRTRRPANYCQARSIIWKRYLHSSYAQWRKERGPNPPKVRMVASELHALFVLYICPRPVFLVSVCDGKASNIFPMDLVGPVAQQRFSIALHTASKALPLIEHSRRIALSSVPAEKIPLAYQLGPNHNETSVSWSSVPFRLAVSSEFCLPIPDFALRVRELEVSEVRQIGSHVLMVCRVVADNAMADGLQFFQAHGFYEEWRRQAIL
jgi:flavin reductase (DIM6/NTAB) family NADH-FMN oxidoreductase RutF